MRSSARTFNVYRGRLSALRAGDYGSCFASDLIDPTATDTELPGTADAFFYLVSGRNADGDGPVTRSLPVQWRFATSPCP